MPKSAFVSSPVLGLVAGASCGDGARSASAPQAAPDAPRAVTRGESSALRTGQQAAKVDWLNATFPGPDRYAPGQFIALLTRVFRRPLSGVEGRGMFGFERGIKLEASVGSRTFPIGFLCYGGASQAGRWMLQLTGSGCSVVSSWSRLSKLLQALEARITRLDLAVDFLDGHVTVDDAVAMHKAGEFTSGGRCPGTSVAGDWIDGQKGRTLYVGSAANGKLLRVYEKGKQGGDLSSDWVRFEVQFGNRDRVIPFRAMTERDLFFCGAYPALAAMLDHASEKILTSQTAGRVGIGHLIFHCKRSYGKLVSTLSDCFRADAESLVHEFRVVGTPRRLRPDVLQSELSWSQLLDHIQRRA